MLLDTMLCSPLRIPTPPSPAAPKSAAWLSLELTSPDGGPVEGCCGVGATVDGPSPHPPPATTPSMDISRAEGVNSTGPVDGRLANIALSPPPPPPPLPLPPPDALLPTIGRPAVSVAPPPPTEAAAVATFDRGSTARNTRPFSSVTGSSWREPPRAAAATAAAVGPGA